jgi:hypothetical protein
MIRVTQRYEFRSDPATLRPMSQSPVQWKNEQREILRASFPTAFVKYTELVNKVNEPDDWRKYLDFIARQVGWRPDQSQRPHDNLACVNINIGGLRLACRWCASDATPAGGSEVDPEPLCSFAGGCQLMALDVPALTEPMLASVDAGRAAHRRHPLRPQRDRRALFASRKFANWLSTRGGTATIS